MTPPHLPQKTENPETRKFIQRLKWFLFIVAMSVLAGASGASMMLGWIWPRFAEGDTWINSYTRPGLSRAQLESLIREEIAARVVRVYRGATTVGTVEYFNKKIGDGIMLSSNGWLTIYQPAYDGVYKNLSIVDNTDRVYAPEAAIWDRQSGFLYIKIKNSQFNKVVEFVDEVDTLDDAFILQEGNWYYAKILYPVFSGKIPHTDSAPIRQHTLDSNYDAGAIAINNQGRIVGFVSNSNSIIPAPVITRALDNILSAKVPTYSSLGIDGWFSEEQSIFVSRGQAVQEAVQGFFVSGVWSSGNPLRKGDVIMEINNRVVTPDNLWYTINNVMSVTAKVLRSGEAVVLDVPVIQTK